MKKHKIVKNSTTAKVTEKIKSRLGKPNNLQKKIMYVCLNLKQSNFTL